jgi:hypothetical protein
LVTGLKDMRDALSFLMKVDEMSRGVIENGLALLKVWLITQFTGDIYEQTHQYRQTLAWQIEMETAPTIWRNAHATNHYPICENILQVRRYDRRSSKDWRRRILVMRRTATTTMRSLDDYHAGQQSLETAFSSVPNIVTKRICKTVARGRT